MLFTTAPVHGIAHPADDVKTRDGIDLFPAPSGTFCSHNERRLSYALSHARLAAPQRRPPPRQPYTVMSGHLNSPRGHRSQHGEERLGDPCAFARGKAPPWTK